MKTIIISIGLCMLGFVTMAQDVDEEFNAAYVNKRGVYLLPQAGDFALGVDATPFLNYLGNIFSSSNEAPSLGKQMTIYGKYFLEDNRALRARLNLNVSNSVDKRFVSDDRKVEDDPEATVIDVQRLSYSDVNLGIGYEFRRGNGRVQGFYGGELLLGYGSEKRKYDYGNRMTEDGASYTNFNGNRISNIERVTQMKTGNSFSVGLGAFLGAEYFFAPQMSLGCEFTLGLNFRADGQGKTTVEKWNSDENDAQIQTIKSKNGDRGNAHQFELLTRSSASIFLMFHF